jgi:hypothetical protein
MSNFETPLAGFYRLDVGLIGGLTVFPKHGSKLIETGLII